MKPIRITEFKGLKNTGDEASLPFGSLSQADNVLINNYSDVEIRSGYQRVANATKLVSSYAASNQKIIFVIENNNLYTFNGDSFTQLATGLTASFYAWTEESPDRVFCIGDNAYIMIDHGTDVTNLIIPKLTGLTAQTGSGSIPKGKALVAAQYFNTEGLHGPLSDPIEVSGNSFSILVTVPEVDGLSARIVAYLPDESSWVPIAITKNFIVINSLNSTGGIVNEIYLNTESIPLSKIWAATYFQARIAIAVLEANETKIRFSLPQRYHLFKITEDFITIPDLVTDMEEVNGQLLITCKDSIYVFTADYRLLKLAEYGTPDGKPILKLPENGCFIWSNRGMCAYPEFKNLTEDSVSVPPGDGCALSLYDYKGSRYALCCNDGQGEAFNKVV